jgi:hypothetical protein
MLLHRKKPARDERQPASFEHRASSMSTQRIHEKLNGLPEPIVARGVVAEYGAMHLVGIRFIHTLQQGVTDCDCSDASLI